MSRIPNSAMPHAWADDSEHAEEVRRARGEVRDEGPSWTKPKPRKLAALFSKLRPKRLRSPHPSRVRAARSRLRVKSKRPSQRLILHLPKSPKWCQSRSKPKRPTKSLSAHAGRRRSLSRQRPRRLQPKPRARRTARPMDLRAAAGGNALSGSERSGLPVFTGENGEPALPHAWRRWPNKSLKPR